MLETIKVEANLPVLVCTMSNGEVYELDLTESLLRPGPLLKPLKDPSFFSQATVGEVGQVIWPNGFDIASDKPARSGRRIS